MTTETLSGELVRAEPMVPMAINQAEQAMATYQELTGRLLTSSDWQNIGKDESFVKRSGWSKLATFYGISTKIIKDEVERDEDGQIIRATMIVRATHPNGRSEEGDGACSITEPRFASRQGRQKADHDVRGTARTRARNRAISDLIGFGKVSAEEVDPGVTATEAGMTVLPAWAQPADVGAVATLLVTILRAANVEQPADRVNRVGQAVMDAADGTVPFVAQLLLEQLVDVIEEHAFPAPAPTPAPAPDPQAEAETP